mmetsp:Transcript_23210/g.58284  ORF Transcript_23210/g.58284 Transcript_23210/m.58284 type:complete len:305 (+) Transcript_23210:2-916(+)
MQNYSAPNSSIALLVEQGRDGGPGGWGDGDLGDGDVAATQLGVRIKGAGKGQRTNLKGSKRKSRDRNRRAGLHQEDTTHLESGFMARPLTTAELDVHLDAIYVKLGEPLEHIGKDMWLHAAGYDMAAPTRTVATGPVTIRPVPTGVELLLTDGVIVWNNALMLLVNMGGRKSRRGNKFLDGGARITWFSSPSHEMGDPAIISRLLPDTRAAEQASELPVLLYCRPGKKLPYVFCGQLGNGEVLKDENNREEAGVAADLLAQEEKREKCTRPGNRCIAWTLLDFEELMATSPHFRNMLEFSSVEI